MGVTTQQSLFGTEAFWGNDIEAQSKHETAVLLKPLR
jgi:hypothetical protein